MPAHVTPEDADHDKIQKTNFYGRKMVYLRALYLSMKYWKKYQVLFFVKHYLLDLQSSWVGLHKLLIKNA